MTTKVQVQYPMPNHLPVKIKRQQRLENGDWIDVDEGVIIDRDKNVYENYVHGSQRLVISELDTPRSS